MWLLWLAVLVSGGFGAVLSWNGAPWWVVMVMVPFVGSGVVVVGAWIWSFDRWRADRAALARPSAPSRVRQSS